MTNNTRMIFCLAALGLFCIFAACEHQADEAKGVIALTSQQPSTKTKVKPSTERKQCETKDSDFALATKSVKIPAPTLTKIEKKHAKAWTLKQQYVRKKFGALANPQGRVIKIGVLSTQEMNLWRARGKVLPRQSPPTKAELEYNTKSASFRLKVAELRAKGLSRKDFMKAVYREKRKIFAASAAK